MITYEEFKKSVIDEIKNCPKDWRKGQAVFNIIDEMYGVAREVQFIDRVDCFYNDDEDVIDLFMTKCWLRLAAFDNAI